MKLISKPCDDSGVDMVDDIARYGLCITKRIEHFRQRNRLRGDAARSLSGLDVSQVLCDTLCSIIDNTSYEPYRRECARAADSIFFESVSPNHLPRQEPPNNHSQSEVLAREIGEILADDEILPADNSVPLQTVLMALVWSALSFANESLPADQARVWVRERIMNSAPQHPYH